MGLLKLLIIFFLATLLVNYAMHTGYEKKLDKANDIVINVVRYAQEKCSNQAELNDYIDYNLTINFSEWE